MQNPKRWVGLALALLTGVVSAHAQTLQKVVFSTDWLAEAEHGGFYQALADGTYRKYGLDVTIRMGGPQVNGLQLLAAGQIDIAMADALQVRVRSRAGRAGGRDRRDVPEESDGDHRASRRSTPRGPQGQADRDRGREQHDVLAVAAPAVRIHRRPEAALRFLAFSHSSPTRRCPSRDS